MSEETKQPSDSGSVFNISPAEGLSRGDLICRQPAGRQAKVVEVRIDKVKVDDGHWVGWVSWPTLLTRWRKMHGPLGCRCQSLRHKVVGDGCDVCNP